MCVCDISKERKEVIDDLNKAHVSLGTTPYHGVVQAIMDIRLFAIVGIL